MPLSREERAEINRQNARKSTGPRTEEGKAASRANALKHGLTARTLAPMRSAEADEYAERRQLWYDDAQPRNVLEAAMIDSACRAHWKLELCAAHDDAQRAARRARATGGLAAATPFERFLKARDYGYLMMKEIEHPTPKELEPLPEGTYNLYDDPAGMREHLCTFIEGVAWLLNQWDRLIWIIGDKTRTPLRESEDLIANRRNRALRLLGLRKESELTCPLIDAAKAEHKRLEALFKEMTEGAGTPPDTGIDLDPALMMRYEAAAERELHRAVNTFLRLRKDPELVPPPEPEPTAPEAEMKPAAARTPRVRRSQPPARNEATVPASDDPDRAPEASRPGSRRPPEGPNPGEAR